MATDSMQNNNDFRNDLLLSYLSTEAVQADLDTFKKFYDEDVEKYIFGLTGKKDVKVESLKFGKDILSYVSSMEQKIKM